MLQLNLQGDRNDGQSQSLGVAQAGPLCRERGPRDSSLSVVVDSGVPFAAGSSFLVADSWEVL